MIYYALGKFHPECLPVAQNPVTPVLNAPKNSFCYLGKVIRIHWRNKITLPDAFKNTKTYHIPHSVKEMFLILSSKLRPKILHVSILFLLIKLVFSYFILNTFHTICSIIPWEFPLTQLHSGNPTVFLPKSIPLISFSCKTIYLKI